MKPVNVKLLTSVGVFIPSKGNNEKFFMRRDLQRIWADNFSENLLKTDYITEVTFDIIMDSRYQTLRQLLAQCIEDNINETH